MLGGFTIKHNVCSMVSCRFQSTFISSYGKL